MATSTRVAMPAAARPRAAAGASTTAGAPLRFSSGCNGTGATAAGTAARSEARRSSSAGRGRLTAAVAPGDGPAPPPAPVPALGEAGDAGATGMAAPASQSSSSSSCSSKPKLSATSFSSACGESKRHQECNSEAARKRMSTGNTRNQLVLPMAAPCSVPCAARWPAPGCELWQRRAWAAKPQLAQRA